ncbi:MAG: RnfABCDGE type electron transport complex subunit D [Candidatus Accumulibacter phosphatis]|nr:MULTISPECIES: RnfABCDGE type electron transport complex subunit D [Candidatus Accumulibacter]MCQ1548174.1 RnfABCDGE type electron transport complex subunit D [Candidatus Accumulibacter phosphatis]HNL22926.1 RnfABCDGE type electron transport complex subunit D [Rhodocyclaceae bacterium]
MQLWYGSRAGSLGETATWLIAAGGVVMIFLRTINWHIPLVMLLGIAILSDHLRPANRAAPGR